MQAWQNFYEMLGGAGATLLGLLFVSVSMNADIILGSTHMQSRRLAEQAFQNYLAVLVVGLLVCLPGNSRQSLGYTLLSMSAIWTGWAVVRLGGTLRNPIISDTRRNVVRRYLSTIVGLGMIGYAAFDLVFGKGEQPTYIAIGAMLLLISATISSWELLTKVAEDKFRAQK
ncbi:MAG TPA: hypothetical protein VMF58_13120 [Rhizomicrobium sp.]|nr:hypothetical protein [Rhizomicrobium sp.]